MKEIYKIYASTFFVGLSTAIGAIGTLFYLANGLNQSQIALLLSAFMITFAVCEIPTGGLADTFGHKASIVWGIIFMALGTLITGLSSSFYLFLLAMIFSAVGFSLNSGAYSSIIHDILNKINKDNDFMKVQGRMGTCLLVGPLISGPFISLLYKYDIRAPFIVSFLFLLIAIIIMSLVKWNFKGNKPSFESYFKKIKNGSNSVLKNKRIIGLIVVSIGLGFSRSLINQNITQPLIISYGIDVVLLGSIFAVISGSEALGSAFSHRLFEKVGKNTSLLSIIFVSAILLMLISQINVAFGLLPLLLFMLVHTYRDNVITTLYRNETSNEERATMLSTISFITYIFIGLMLPFGGFGLDAFGIKSVLAIMGGLTIIFGIVGFYIYHR